MTPAKIIQNAIGCVLAALFAGNIYFIKRLVDKIDATEQTVSDLRIQVAVLTAKLESCPKKRGPTH